ncbi:MAG: cation transporter [Chloroflexota bacterium]
MTKSIVAIDLGVGGMTCDDCVVHVTDAKSVAGVESARVDFDSRGAVVTAQSDVVAEVLAAAVRTTGHYNAFERRRRAVSGE